ncbi:MAG: amidohydrolase family protein [Deltaproteobacteria bacterium]|nr:amidohydrolase family protein [Deltaproteobacteria bacterium]
MQRFFLKWLVLRIVLSICSFSICCIAAEEGNVVNDIRIDGKPHDSYFFRYEPPPAISSSSDITIKNAEIVFNSRRCASENLVLHGRIIAKQTCTVDSELTGFRNTVNAGGYRIYPALINAHDHGFSNWSPPIKTLKFTNYVEWIDHVHKHSDPSIAENRITSFADRLDLMFYKQVFNGVGTVELFTDNTNKYYVYQYPIRILDMFSHSHSILVGERRTALDYARTKGVQPFLIHLGEGKDEAMRKELGCLDRLGALSSNTVLIHGIAFKEGDWKRIARTGAALVWCPSSNMHLYGTTADIPGALKAGVRVCIGTDGAITGGKGLLEELRVAQRIYPNISSQKLFEMVTETAASILAIDDQVGTLDPGKRADLLIVRKKSDDPFRDLIELQPEDIGLLMVDGVPVFGDVFFLNEFRLPVERVKHIQVAGKKKFLVGDLEGLLASIARTIGYAKGFDFLPTIEWSRDTAAE